MSQQFGMRSLRGAVRRCFDRLKPLLFSVALAGVAVPGLAGPPSGLSTEDGTRSAGRDREGLSPEERRSGSGDRKPLNSPLLRGLRQTIDGAGGVDDGGVRQVLSQQLEQTDALLHSVREQNRLALRSVTRQQRVGRARQSPHVLLITIDRVGWQEFSCYGHPEFRTPRIDQFASEGLRLTRFYSGSADGRAARWTMLTGLNTGRASPDRSDRYRVHDADHTMAEWLWDAGYVTGFFGLWTNGDLPTRHGFEDWSGFLSRDQVADGFPESVCINGATVSVLANQNGARGISLERLLASELHSWLTDIRPQKRQFFAHVAIPVLPGADDAGTRSLLEQRRAAVEQVDVIVGRLLDVLQSAGLAERTCVILTAESGPEPAHPELVKELELTGELTHADHGLSEGNLRVPMVIRWPRHVAPGTVSDYPSVACDLVPTLCELAVASRRPARSDGVSLVRLLLGRDQPAHPLLYWETLTDRKGQVAQTGDWKCVRLPGSHRISLYNLQDDPSESIDVAARHPEVLRRLTR